MNDIGSTVLVKRFGCNPDWGATQKSCTIFLALKGRNIPAQGNALGKWAYVQFRGSEFHTRNARFRQPQEQRRAKAHSRQAKSKQFNFNGSSSPLEGG